MAKSLKSLGLSECCNAVRQLMQRGVGIDKEFVEKCRLYDIDELIAMGNISSIDKKEMLSNMIKNVEFLNVVYCRMLSSDMLCLLRVGLIKGYSLVRSVSKSPAYVYLWYDLQEHGYSVVNTSENVIITLKDKLVYKGRDLTDTQVQAMQIKLQRGIPLINS